MIKEMEMESWFYQMVLRLGNYGKMGKRLEKTERSISKKESWFYLSLDFK
jgi:hypothetical protein